MVAVLHPTGPGSQIVIDRAVVLVGRSPDCDAIIEFSPKISRMHCVLLQVDADYYLRDLGSMNGVRVNGERVEKIAKLVHGAEVAIGDVIFQFHANVQPPPRLQIRTHEVAKGLPVLIDESAPLLDAHLIDNAEFIDDAPVVEIMREIDFVDDIVDELEFIGEIEVIEDVEIIDEVAVIDDAPIVTNDIHHARRPPRLR